MSTALKLDDTTNDRLIALGQKMDRSPQWIMKRAIEQYLSEQEQYWEEREDDMTRWKHYLLTDEHVPNDKVIAWLDAIIAGDETSCPV